MTEEGRTADIGVWRRRTRNRTHLRSILLVFILGAILFSALALKMNGESDSPATSPKESEPVSIPERQYCPAIYCFESPKTLFTAGGKSICTFTWDLSLPSTHAYRYVDTIVSNSNGKYQVSQREETIPNAPLAGLAWDPDPGCTQAYYRGLGLRAWISAWGGKAVSLLLKENNGKELARWNYTGQSVLYFGASDAGGMGIAMNDWRAGSWSPSQSVFFEYQTSSGLKMNNASLDVMVMAPTQVAVPEFGIIIPIASLIVALPILRRWRASDRHPQNPEKQ